MSSSSPSVLIKNYYAFDLVLCLKPAKASFICSRLYAYTKDVSDAVLNQMCLRSKCYAFHYRNWLSQFKPNLHRIDFCYFGNKHNKHVLYPRRTWLHDNEKTILPFHRGTGRTKERLCRSPPSIADAQDPRRRHAERPEGLPSGFRPNCRSFRSACLRVDISWGSQNNHCLFGCFYLQKFNCTI